METETMAITIKNEEQIALMRRAGQMLARVHKELAGELHEGMTTMDVDRIVEEMIMSFGGYPNFKGYNGFPAAACVSVNDEIVHGIPSDKRYLKNGDIVTIDTGVLYEGYHSDAARTHAIGEISDDAKKLIRVTEDAFFEAIKNVKPGNHIVDIGRVVQQIALHNGYSVVRTLTGHGIGEDLHEAPNVPNYRTLLKGARMRKGMTLAIEPMINMGNYDVILLDNKWTYATADGSLSSHYENTVAVTDDGCEILTLTPEEMEARSGEAADSFEKNQPRGDIKEAIRVIPDEFQTAALAREDQLEEGTREDQPEEGAKEDQPEVGARTEDKAKPKGKPKRKPGPEPEHKLKGKTETEEKIKSEEIPKINPKGEAEDEEQIKSLRKYNRKSETEEKTNSKGSFNKNSEAEDRTKSEGKYNRKSEAEEKTISQGKQKEKTGKEDKTKPEKKRQNKTETEEKAGTEEKSKGKSEAEEKITSEGRFKRKAEAEEKKKPEEEKTGEGIPENDKPYQTLTAEEKKKRRDALFEDE